MSEGATPSPHSAEMTRTHLAPQSTVSWPYLLLAVAIIAAGIMLFTEFMLTLSVEFLPSVLFFLVGGLMLFHPLSGADRSA